MTNYKGVIPGFIILFATGILYRKYQDKVASFDNEGERGAYPKVPAERECAIRSQEAGDVDTRSVQDERPHVQGLWCAKHGEP